MRKIEIQETDKKKVTIETPWMSINDSIAYLGISRSEFMKIKDKIPHKGFGRARRYHADKLDEYDPNGEKKQS